MADTVSKQQRSKNMALIKSVGNKSTEVALISLMRASKISGWRRGNKIIPGRPDFVFAKERIALFVDGCFWHGCKKCGIVPKTNKAYWSQKISRNIKRDRIVKKELKKNSWILIRVWEHELKQAPNCVAIKIKSVLNAKRA